MKRTRLRRKPQSREDDAERIAHQLFREAGQKQRCCQMCGKAGSDWHPHHVVYAQHLRSEGHPVYDTRNVMRLCVECHASHHNRSKIIPLTKLKDMHFEYAFEKMGVRAHDYLKRLYGGEDDRLDRCLRETEEDEDERRNAGAAPV